MSVSRRSFNAALAAAAVSPFSIVHAQSAQLKIGVLLPRSGVQAGIGQDCQRGVEIAPAILKGLGLPDLAIMNADTESNVEVARSRGLSSRRACSDATCVAGSVPATAAAGTDGAALTGVGADAGEARRNPCLPGAVS